MQLANSLLLISSVMYVGLIGSIALSAQETTHATDAHHHPEAQKLVNPVEPTAEAIAAGRKIFEDHCLECHGDEGKGDGMAGEDLDPLPADLTDAEWKHGDTDGEIFVVIRDGTRSGMKKFGRKLTGTEIWQVVTYIRSIGPKRN